MLFVLACIGVGQLRTARIAVTCCCPDPAACKCPDHAAGHSKQAQLRACHRSTEIAVSADAPVIEPPVRIAIVPDVRVSTVASIALPSPRIAPDRERPSGPA